MSYSDKEEVLSHGGNKFRINKPKRSLRQGSMNFSLLSKVGTAKWRSNNLSLAKENAKYKKEIQKLTRMLSEQSIRYRSLEMSWLHRGESLAKIDLAAARLGNQFMKILDTFKEIRTLSQKELNVPFDGLIKDTAHHLRKSMPNLKLDIESPNAKGQLVNPVNPMVSGHAIITKPTIALKRLKVRRIQEKTEAPVVNSSVIDVDSDSSDGTLGPIAEVSSRGQELEEHNDTSNEVSTYPPEEIPALPVAEVPLERLSLSRLSSAQRRSSNVISGCILQGDNTVIIKSSVQNEKQNVSSNVTYRASNSASTVHSPRMENKRQSNTVSLPKTKCIVLDQTDRQLGDVQILLRDAIKLTPNNIRPDSPTPLSNQRISSSVGRSSGVKKYGPSNRSRSSGPDTPKNGLNKYNEVFKPLIIALKDVGSCLQNGRLVGIDQLEEGKVKTGAEPKSQQVSGRNHDNDITLIETNANDQTHLNFTAGIGTLEYTRTSVGEYNDDHDSAEHHNSLSPEEEFHKRIAAEDPLEGPSWRYHSYTSPRGRKSTLSKRPYDCYSLKKEKSDKELSEENSDSADEVQNIKKSVSNQNTPEKKNTSTTQAEENVDDKTSIDMDITDSIHIISMKHSSENGNKFTSCLNAERNIGESRTNSAYFSKGIKSSAENSSDEDWEPSRKRKSEQRKRVKNKETKRKTEKKSTSHRNSALKVNKNRGSGNSTNRSLSLSRNSIKNNSDDGNKPPKDFKLTKAFVHLEILTPELSNSNSSISEPGRARRRAAPTTFRELSLHKKLRRGDAFLE